MGPWNPTQGQIIKVKVPEEPVLKYKHEVDTWRWNRGHQISAQIKIRQLFFFLPAVSRVSLTLPPIVPRFIPLHLSLILMCCQPWNSTSLKVERIRVWRVNTSESQSKGLQKMLTFVTPLWRFSLLHCWPLSPEHKVASKQEEKKTIQDEIWCHRELATMS